jgi:hypothetical protein
MDKIVRYAAYLVCALQLIAVGAIVANAYSSRDALLGCLVAVPPLLFVAALLMSPDLEERRQRRQVAKLRLRAELQELEAKTKTK